MRSIASSLIFCLPLLSFISVAEATLFPTAQYQTFFPEWHDFVQPPIKEATDQDKAGECYQNLTFYRDEGTSSSAYPVYGCILATFPEYRKAEQAAAGVILGLAPSIIQQLSPTTSETSLLAMRRPLLAVIVAFLTPGVRVLESREHPEYLKDMQEGVKFSFQAPFIKSQRLGKILSAAWPYIFGLATLIVVNIYVTYELSFYAICTFAPSVTGLPFAWTLSASLIHFISWCANSRIVKEDPTALWAAGKPWWRRALESEFQASCDAPALDIKGKGARKFKTDKWFASIMGVMNACSYLHVVLGTMIMSSIIFVGVRDSVGVICRYILCALVCRAILVFEIAGLRKSGLTGTIP